MHEIESMGSGGPGVDRRKLLMTGGALAAAATAGAGALALGSSPAGAVTLTPVYSPSTPVRVFDSRSSLGPIHGGEVDTLTGAAPDVSIWAYNFNLTIVDTVATGYLSVYEAGVAWPGNSSINWFTTGQIAANNVFTWFRPSDSGITVRAGGPGQTNYVLDITAVLQAVDLSSFSATARARTASAAHESVSMLSVSRSSD
jgi:hypothetical protein